MARGQAPAMQVTTLPAPIGGVDGRFSLASNRPENCTYAYNLVPTEYGLRTREGYREWVIGLGGLGVRTLIPSRGVTGSESGDALFVTTNEGIWDVTTPAVPPVSELTFTTQTDAAGWGHYTHYTDDAGNSSIFLADSANGLFEYDISLGTWAQAPGIIGVDVTNIVFVVVHKQRIWLIEKDATHAWYLPIGAKAGTVQRFEFGSKFKHGGELVGLYNWTLDSGSGVDDVLVGVSRAGDVLPYTGSDPSQVYSWELIGSYFIGDVPAGRRVASEFGGELHLLSDYGLVSMSDLLRGVSNTGQAMERTQKVSRFIRDDMDLYAQDRGWEIKFNTNEGVLLVNTPKRIDQYLQYRANLAVGDGGAWGFWRGVPGLTFEPWRNRLMIGTEDGRVLRMDTTVDESTIADPVGKPVEFSLLGNFLDFGGPGRFKWGSHARPDFLATQRPSFEAKFVYDFDIAELPQVGAPVDVPQSAWDSSLWDAAVWGADRAVAHSRLFGSWGPGRTMAVAIRGSSVTRTTLASYDVMWHAGGPL